MPKRKRAKTPKPKKKDVAQLVGIGGGSWTEAQAKEALLACGNNVEQAMFHIMANQLPDADAPPAPPPAKRKKLNEPPEPPPEPKEPSPPPEPPYEIQHREAKTKFEAEKETIEKQILAVQVKLEETQPLSSQIQLIRFSKKWPKETTDPDAVWLREQILDIRKAMDLQRGQHNRTITTLKDELKIKGERFLETKKEYDSQKAIAEILDEEARSGVRMSADDRNVHLLSRNGKKIEKEYSCPICFCEYPLNEFAILDCLHGFCRSCMGQTVQIKVKDGINGIALLNCPHVSGEEEKDKGPCTHKLTHEEVRLFIGDSDLFQKYEKLQLHQTLNQAEDCRWCPHPGCETAMFGDTTSPMMECPKCQMKFCFNCKTTEWHSGSSCAQFQQWKKDNDQCDAKFEEWKKQNTAPCPKCKSTIEKNGGCMHMTCSNCRYEFHWVTREKWKGYKANYAVSWQASAANQRPPPNVYANTT